MEKLKPKTIEDYISAFPDDIKLRLTKIREAIKNAVPDAEESIRYGMPAFKLNKEHIYISAYKNHIGMYPMYGMESLEKELAIYRGKGTKDALHFSHKQDLPLSLIKKIVMLKASGTKG
jgi:uncharacterized protein YdhG (YjbR/CyaY superfamily)